MSVSFDDAKKTLHSMFPAMDEETIGDILRQQNGHMESAVEVGTCFVVLSSRSHLQQFPIP